MSLPTIITITNPNVNSGATINLNAKSINGAYEIKNNVKAMPLVSVPATYVEGLQNSKYTGFSNPTHTVQGVIDLNIAHTTGALASIDREYVTELIRNGDQTMTLTNNKFKTTLNTTGTINVVLKNYTDVLANENTNMFTMVFTEVQS